MTNNFSNSILIIVFNYSKHIENKDILIDLYKEHFKKIYIYSDLPRREGVVDEDVNYVPIDRGFFTYRVFTHFYDNYKSEIEKSDGLFYTMDDCLINLNIINQYDTSKILFKFANNPLPFKGIPNQWWWHSWMGKPSLKTLMDDKDFSLYNSDKFCGEFADYFFLPKKYLTSKLFKLFNLFSKYSIFLEIAIPSILKNIEPDSSKYHSFKSAELWQGQRDGEHNTNAYIKGHNLIIHPVKLSVMNPSCLHQIFCKKKCVIITTINEPTDTIRKHIDNSEYDVIIVGDLKTPDTYKHENCIFLDVENQKQLFPTLCELIPYNHYGRKNLGYLYAIKKGYDIIYETDDDNIPHENFDHVLDFSDLPQTIKDSNFQWINIFKYFTNNNWIWPRGYPLSNIKQNSRPNFEFDNSKSKKDVAIINGLVENDPDVDAIFRLVCNHKVDWVKNKKVIISNENICPFNTQNTFWLDPSLFIALLIPCSVTFRYCDILKGIVANILLKHLDRNMVYTSPNVTQLRNEHDLMEDFESEVPMYLANENIVPKLMDLKLEGLSLQDAMLKIYQKLHHEKIITELDLKICQAWVSAII